MKKIFNIAGPCNPNEHYMIPSEERCQGIPDLIDQKQYFVIHAARQTGKTTLLLELVNHLNDSGRYYALYCSLESVQGISDPEKGIPAIVGEIIAETKLHDELKKYHFGENAVYNDFNTVLRTAFSDFCIKLNKPLVVLFDETDCLTEQTLISFLRQLRYGYVNRNRVPFIHSAGLVGMRNIRDYKAKIRNGRETLGSASPFNIVSEIFTLKNFTKEQVIKLYAQHTKQTDQIFSDEVIERIYHYTQGQPWLVNAVAREIVVKILESDYSKLVFADHVEQAVLNIILRRDTHIDSLMERLKEERVQKIIQPVILGEIRGYDILDDDYQYVLDLGLICISEKKPVPANPVYAEVMIRTLSSQSQMAMDISDYPPYFPAYLVEGRIDMKKLLSDFQSFWRQNSEIWIEKYQYKEAAPHLILQAFLQRVMNAGAEFPEKWLWEANGLIYVFIMMEKIIP